MHGEVVVQIDGRLCCIWFYIEPFCKWCEVEPFSKRFYLEPFITHLPSISTTISPCNDPFKLADGYIQNSWF